MLDAYILSDTLAHPSVRQNHLSRILCLKRDSSRFKTAVIKVFHSDPKDHVLICTPAGLTLRAVLAVEATDLLFAP